MEILVQEYLGRTQNNRSEEVIFSSTLYRSFIRK